MSDVTRILSAIHDGDQLASEQLLPLVYDELKQLAAAKMARERPGQTLQATALVHEAYLRLVDTEHAQRWDSRRHFFAAAAEAMRRILINRARDKSRLKRGGNRRRLDLDKLTTVPGTSLVAAPRRRPRTTTRRQSSKRSAPRSVPTSSCKRSGRGALASSTWPSRRSRSGVESRSRSSRRAWIPVRLSRASRPSVRLSR